MDHVRGVGHELHLFKLLTILSTLPPQGGDMDIVVRDEILEDNPPEYPKMIEFELYCETFLDRWISTLVPQPEPEGDPEEDP